MTFEGVQSIKDVKAIKGIKAVKGIKGVKAVMAVMAFAVLSAVSAPPPAASAEPAPENGIRKIAVPCSLCAKSSEGRGRLKLHPPDHGQHQGSIHAKDHWDVRLACPLCGGKGRRTVYRLEVPRTLEDVPPCRVCGWSGVERCRKCKATGLQPCTARDCKSGWIVRKNEIGSGKHNRHYKMQVEPCPTCHGVGRVVCPECRGMEGTPCRACSGMGKKVR